LAQGLSYLLRASALIQGVCRKNDLAAHYPKLAETDDSFDLFCSISKYNIRKSAFFTDETSKTVSDCFAYVMDRIRRDFEAAGMNFDDALFRPTRKLVAWKPFKDALFYTPVKHSDRQIVLSENEIYMCKNNEWKFSTIITTEKGRQFIGYVMKQMESVLRKVKKYRFKLTANTDMINEDTIRILTKAGLFIEKIVPAAVMEYRPNQRRSVGYAGIAHRRRTDTAKNRRADADTVYGAGSKHIRRYSIRNRRRTRSRL